MYQSSFVQECEPVKQLLSEHPHECGTQSTELILLDQLVKINAEQLKHQAQMLAMDEGVL